MKSCNLSAQKICFLTLTVLAFTGLVILFSPAKSYAAEAPSPNYTGWDSTYTYWFDNGAMATNKEAYDPASNAWYWFDADGTKATNKDVYMPYANKWVRYNEAGHMIKGEDYRYGAWYYFEEQTGAMLKGVNLICGGDGLKWVYYDVITGQMAHGQAALTYDSEHWGWYNFDAISGAMSHGVTLVSEANGSLKWVYYDIITGKMVYGEVLLTYDAEHFDWYMFDYTTGAMKHGFYQFDSKLVYYNTTTGKMAHGEEFVCGQEGYCDGWYGFDETSGSRLLGWKWQSNGYKLVYYHPDITGAMVHGWFSDRYGLSYHADETFGGLVANVTPIYAGRSIWDFASVQGVGAEYVALEGWGDDNYNTNLLKCANLRRGGNSVTADQINDFLASTERGRAGTLAGHGQDVIDAANEAGIDAVYLLAHAIGETGWGTSNLSAGHWWDEHTFNGTTYPGGNYYNFFGWGAFDSNAYNSGMNYAQINGWTSVRAALIGGAKVIASGYIYSGRSLNGFSDAAQRTLYEMRYDLMYTVATGEKSSHEYATSPTWTAMDSSIMASFYKRYSIHPEYEYIIPVFS